MGRFVYVNVVETPAETQLEGFVYESKEKAATYAMRFAREEYKAADGFTIEQNPNGLTVYYNGGRYCVVKHVKLMMAY